MFEAIKGFLIFMLIMSCLGIGVNYRSKPAFSNVGPLIVLLGLLLLGELVGGLF